MIFWRHASWQIQLLTRYWSLIRDPVAVGLDRMSIVTVNSSHRSFISRRRSNVWAESGSVRSRKLWVSCKTNSLMKSLANESSKPSKVTQLPKSQLNSSCPIMMCLSLQGHRCSQQRTSGRVVVVVYSTFLFLSGLWFLSFLEDLDFSSCLDSLSSSSTTFSTPRDKLKWDFHLRNPIDFYLTNAWH